MSSRLNRFVALIAGAFAYGGACLYVIVFSGMIMGFACDSCTPQTGELLDWIMMGEYALAAIGGVALLVIGVRWLQKAE
jgi:hypothetical protein